MHRQLRLLTTPPTSTSARPPTAPARAPRPRPTAATPARCRSARPSRSTAPRSPARSSTTRGSRCRPRARRTPTPAPTTTSRSSGSTPPTTGRSTRRSRSGAGPNAVGATTALRDKVYSYGNSSLRGGVTQLSPKEGYSLGQEGGGWTHTVYTLTPGIPGDSGSAFLSKDGAALGTLSTVAIAPITGSNGVGDIAARVQLHEGQQRLQRRLARAGHRAVRARLAAVGLVHPGRGFGRARAARSDGGRAQHVEPRPRRRGDVGEVDLAQERLVALVRLERPQRLVGRRAARRGRSPSASCAPPSLKAASPKSGSTKSARRSEPTAAAGSSRSSSSRPRWK